MLIILRLFTNSLFAVITCFDSCSFEWKKFGPTAHIEKVVVLSMRLAATLFCFFKAQKILISAKGFGSPVVITPWQQLPPDYFLAFCNIRCRLLECDEIDENIGTIVVNPLSANLTKRSNTLKQFVSFCRRIVLGCLTILWGWRLKG